MQARDLQESARGGVDVTDNWLRNSELQFNYCVRGRDESGVVTQKIQMEAEWRTEP